MSCRGGPARGWTRTPQRSRPPTAKLDAARAKAAGLTVRTPAERERDPERAAEYIAFVAAAKEFDAVMRTVDNLVPVLPSGWPGIQIVDAKDYPTLWPAFDLGLMPLALHYGRVLEKSRAPWNRAEISTRFLAVSTTGVKLSVAAGPRDLAARQDAIVAMAKSRRQARLKVR